MIREEERQDIMSEARRPRAKRAFQEHLNAIMLSVVGFILVFMFMAAMTKITFDAELSWVDVGFQTALMYVCTVTIHIILRSYARRKGRDTEKWKTARENLELNGRAIVDRGLTKRTSAYCRAWEEHDVNTLRERILKECGVTLQEFNEKYAKYSLKEIKNNYPNLTKEQYKAIRRAKRVRRLHYDESYLSVRDRVGLFRRAPSGGIKAKTAIKINTAQVFVTSGFASLFSVYIAADLIVNFSFATIVLCLVKVTVLVIFAVFGVIGGYKFATGREVDEMEDRADEQRRFLKWCEETPEEEEKSTETYERAQTPPEENAIL